MKDYKNFQELDDDIKILKLKSRINEEHLKLSVKDFKNEFRPMNIFTSVAAKIAEHVILRKSASRFTHTKKQ